MKTTAYDMIMEFDVTLGLKAVNEIMAICGFREKAALEHQTITIKQTLAFIPDEKYIHTVENILREKYETEQLNVLKCTFKGYSKLIPIEIDIENEENEVHDLDL